VCTELAKMLAGKELARAVLAAPNRYALLSLGSEHPIYVDERSGFLNLEDEQIRRVYMRMSQKIHPDRLRDCDEATLAFQALVRAYEHW